MDQLHDTPLHFVTGRHGRWRELLPRLDAVIRRERKRVEQLQL